MDRFFRSDHCANAINPEAKKPNNGERRQIQNKSRTHYVLNKLLVAADKNSSRKKEGFRYDDDMKIFSSYVRMLTGPLAYETVQKNLPGALPALSSTNRYVRKSNCRLQEGILRCHELYLFLTSRNLPLLVSLSEDATRIVGRVQYDATTNQLVGFVLPISSSNGLPIPFIYQGRDANEIAKHFSGANPIASFVNAVMAQPIPGGPPFCLLLFGSDNRYTSADVANRWKYIAQELEKLNIAVLTISSDSDPKYNSAMRKLSLLGYESNIFEGNEWFSCGENLNPPFYIQDMTHIGTKLRNFLLRTTNDSKKLPFGSKYIVDIKHLHKILETLPKDQHLLTAHVLNPADRQNFSSVLRICDKKVSNLIEKNVKNSVGTKKFLEIIRDVIDSTWITICHH